MATPPINKIPDNISNAYMAGWGTAHHGGIAITSLEDPGEFAAWQKGFNDCRRGAIDAIDAVYALGPELLLEREDNRQTSDFDKWWYEFGSGLAPFPGEEPYMHVKRVARLAWDEARRHYVRS